MDIQIRKAEEKDFVLLLDLIKQSAESTDKKQSVKISVEDLKNNNDIFTCLLAETKQARVVGYALYQYVFKRDIGKSIFLEDLFVDGSFQNRKIGTMLVCSLMDIAKQKKCKSIGWSLSLSLSSQNEKAIYFYKKIGAKTDKDSINFHFEIK